MDTETTRYYLPSHPSLACLDPLGTSDEANPSVWDVITSSIRTFQSKPTTILQLPNLIEDLSYSLHSNGRLDTTFLLKYLSRKFLDPPVGQHVLDTILNSALALPSLFPSHYIPYLDSSNPKIVLSTPQILCLVAHQILNTFKPPAGNTWGCTFTCWYSEPQPLKHAVRGYLEIVFQYFLIPSNPLAFITYEFFAIPSLNEGEAAAAWDSCADDTFFSSVVIDTVTPTTVPFPHNSANCTLVASNQSPGFGPACTQEELVTAACPALLPLGALLISPPVPETAAILAYGHFLMSSWQGQGRDARLVGNLTERDHCFVLLDASELDTHLSSVHIPDLDVKVLLRDLHKAYTGFCAVSKRGITRVVSPLWGAGAFGGDPIIKTLILALAAARTSVSLHLLVDKDRTYMATRATPAGPPRLLTQILQDLKKSSNSMSAAGAFRCLRAAGGFQTAEDVVRVLKSNSNMHGAGGVVT